MDAAALAPYTAKSKFRARPNVSSPALAGEEGARREAVGR
jgi:hypothetical protein